MADPLTMALIMGGGAAVKGIGQGIAAYQGAQGMMSDFEKEQMKKLQREQEMGLLGFSPQEMADMREAITNPMAALERQQADQLKGTMAATGAGAGDAFRVALAQADIAAERRAAVQDKIQAANLAEKQREENMLMALSNKAAQQEAAKKAAITQAITLGIGGAVETGSKGYLLAEETAPGTDESEDLVLDAETLKILDSFFKATSGG